MRLFTFSSAHRGDKLHEILFRMWKLEPHTDFPDHTVWHWQAIVNTKKKKKKKYPHNGGKHEDRDLENCAFWGLVFYGRSNRSAAAFAPLRRTPLLGFIRLFRLLLTKRAMGRRGGQKPRGKETNSFWLSSFSQSDAGESLHISVTVLLAGANSFKI